MKYLITILLLLLSGCGLPTPPFGAGVTDTLLTEVPSIVKTKTGDFAYSEFQNTKTGEKIKVPITIEEYKSLGLKGAGQPKLEGYEWLGAGAGDVIATSTPILSNYQFYKAGIDIASSTLVMIKIPGKTAQIIKGEYIVNNKLTAEGLSLIK